jgi:hypothetical protein
VCPVSPKEPSVTPLTRILLRLCQFGTSDSRLPLKWQGPCLPLKTPFAWRYPLLFLIV